MSNNKKTWKEKILAFMVENVEYFEGISVFLTGSDFVPYNR